MSGFFAQQTPQPAVRLTDDERQRVNKRAAVELMQLVLAQAFAALLVSLIALLVSGPQAAFSALAGAGAYFVPSCLFALRLLIAMQRPGGSGPALFLVGEMLKMMAAVALLWLVARLGGDSVHWLAVFFGLLAVLKSYFLVFAYRALCRC